MSRIATTLLLISGSALAHEGHSAAAVHLHWLEYVLLAAVIAGVALYAARK